MIKTNGSVSEAPGAEVKKKPPSVADVKEFAKRDLNSAVMLLDAIYRDDALLEAIAVLLHGRYLNHLHKKELESQVEINPKK